MDGEIERLIEPSTMLIHSENLTRTIHTTLEGPGGAFKMKTTEIKHARIEYEAK